MENNSIKKNVILNFTYNVINIVFPIITFPYVSRILSVAGLGNVTFFSSIANYSVMVASLGISTYGIRAVSRVKDKKQELSETTFELLVINAIATILVISLLLFSSLFVSKFANEWHLLLINCVLVFATPFGLNWLFSGLEQYSYITKRSIVVKIISLLLVFLLIKKKEDYCIYAGIVSFSGAGAYLFNFFYSKKFISFKGLKNFEFRRHFKPMMILFASSLAISVYINLDTIMLGFINGDEQVGLYTIAVKVKSMLLIAVNAISTVLLPRLSYFIVNNRWDDFQRILKKSLSTITMIAIPLMLFFMIESRDSILFLGGKEFIDATICMQIIMPILLISGISNISGNQILIPMGKEICFMKAVIAGALVDLVLNIILMPLWGCIGAAIATLLAECTQMGIQLYYSKKFIFQAVQLRTIAKVVIAAIIASIITVVTSQIIHFNCIINLTATAIVYFGSYILILLLFREQLMVESFSFIVKRG